MLHFFSCSSNPECGWCQTDGICYLRTDAAKCTSNLKTVKCPGLCEALPNCQSCAQHGKRYRAKESVSKVIDILRLLEHFRQNLQIPIDQTLFNQKLLIVSNVLFKLNHTTHNGCYPLCVVRFKVNKTLKSILPWF